MEHVVTIVGLALELIGVVLLWQFGWPQPQVDGGVGLAIEDGTPVREDGTPDASGRITAGEYRVRVGWRRLFYQGWSGIGFSVLCFGLVIQVAAQFIAKA